MYRPSSFSYICSEISILMSLCSIFLLSVIFPNLVKEWSVSLLYSLVNELRLELLCSSLYLLMKKFFINSKVTGLFSSEASTYFELLFLECTALNICFLYKSTDYKHVVIPCGSCCSCRPRNHCFQIIPKMV